MSDQQLVSEALQGSQDAYTELYRRLKPRASGIACAFLRYRPQDQDDFTHDATARVLLLLPRYRQEAARLSTWATVVMRNLAREHLRRARAMARCAEMVYLDAALTEDGDLQADVPDAALSPETALSTAERVQVVLGGVNERQRTLLWQAYALGFSNQELATMHGSTPAQIQYALKCAKARGRAAMATREARSGPKREIKPAAEVTPRTQPRTCMCGCGVTIPWRGGPYAEGHAPKLAAAAAAVPVTTPLVHEASPKAKPPASETTRVPVTMMLSERQVDLLWRSLPLQQRAALLMRSAEVAHTA